ncbi:MAG: hypothetical protein RLO51_26165 [Thalassobaculum sp.]|uniref:hypothetical protein n=1 Tax=Thalassobaculum sp. TaxID=2022740 RepID=UPI0032ED8F2E
MWRAARDTNALIEMLVLLQFTSGIEGRISALMAARDSFEEFLPKVWTPEFAGVVRFAMNGGKFDVQRTEPDPARAIPEMRMSRVMPDGEDEWLVWARGPFISTHCHYYTRWSSVWPKMRDLLLRSSETVMDGSCEVSSVMVQYTDLFTWKGEGAPEHAALLQKIGMPELQRNRGLSENWHNHQGWFCDDSNELVERRLERVHIDSITLEGSPAVKIDNMLRFDLATPAPNHATVWEVLDEVVPRCREMNKAVMRSLLAPAMVDQIGLDSEG